MIKIFIHNINHNIKSLINFLPYTLSLSLPISVIIGCYVGGFWTLLAIFVGYIILPLSDILLLKFLNKENFYQHKGPALLFLYRLLVCFSLPVQLIVIFYVGYKIYSGDMFLFEIVCITLSAGISGGAFGITAAHELIHQRKIERFLARILLWTTCYAHFCIEHVKGHHVNVGTIKDPATSRLGESLYRFLPRTIYGGFINAWQLESNRLKRKKISYKYFNHKILQDIYIYFLIFIFLIMLGNIELLFFFFGASVISILELEAVNYIEHYGLFRKKLKSGKLEVQSSRHSWNSNYIISNWSLFNLPLHADHHNFAGKRYYELKDDLQAPQLPFNYSLMVLLALVPSLWMKVMDPRAKQAMHDFVVDS